MPNHLLRTTISLCSACKCSVEATLWRIENRVVVCKKCLAHGAEEALISTNVKRHEEVMNQPPVLPAPPAAQPAD